MERNKLFTDIYDGKRPKRVPIILDLKWDAAITYRNMDLKRSLWDSSCIMDFMDPVSTEFQADKLPVGANTRPPLLYQLLGSKCIIMSESGTMQHPEVHSLKPEEYDEFIADPYKCMCEKLLPRLYSELDAPKGKAALTFAIAYKAKADVMAPMIKCMNEVTEKYGFCNIPGGGFTEAPFDFLADFIRSFSGISGDVRRYPAKVEAACEAILPHMLKVGLVPNSSNYSRTYIPLHMGPYLNQKQFDRFWWPTFASLMKGLDDAGAGVTLFVEQNWMRYIDYLCDLPGRVELLFEYGDPALTVEKVNGKHIIEGFYPSVLAQTGTKEQCLDKTKELLDILCRDGNYIFSFDKSFYSLKDPIRTNLHAILDYVLTNGIY